MRKDINKFIFTCGICLLFKGGKQNIGLDTPLPLPKKLWDEISMDFFYRLPRTKKGYESIFVVVDRFSKLAHFMVCKKTNDASRTDDLFFKEIMKLHGLLNSITCYRDTKFFSHF